jgi:hypothetical protein
MIKVYPSLPQYPHFLCSYLNHLFYMFEKIFMISYLYAYRIQRQYNIQITEVNIDKLKITAYRGSLGKSYLKSSTYKNCIRGFGMHCIE